MKNTFLLALLFLTHFALHAQKSPYENLHKENQPQNLKSDIDSWLEWLHSTHPDLSYTVKDIDRFYKTVSQIKDSITTPMTVLEFWKRISPLNYQLSDGHLIVGHIDGSIVADYVKKGGNFFPFEVVFNGDKLCIYSALGGKASVYKGFEIVTLNEKPIASIIEQMLIRINGDSDAHRKILLQRKFALFYMLLFGKMDEFKMTVRKANLDEKIRTTAASELPKFYNPVAFYDNFNYRIIDNGNAILTINEFGWNDKKAYYSFMDSVFRDISRSKIKHLIIDVRGNGGGDDEFWMKGILKYIANKPYKWGSTYKKKIISKYRDAGEVIGSTITGKIDTLIEPEKNNPYKFTGKVSILIGPYTYSSAILFINTIQDYKFGQLVGEPTGGKSGQTGAIQFSRMPNTGLTMITPRFYLERPKGGGLLQPVNPDIKILYDKIRPEELIDLLLQRK